ncbi:diheme cytochrome c-553 [Pseudoflavitalea rhizosphaerae]|uniref:diheme cytochrome c-553 n=1 Tax=Pseudoflavitalea rhizosphaerae TaxID=1884793 RepID=UPI000F8D95F6|nr:diheme cytochrome c-553 [Pseudoflavitalea rhizosphaerae]
MKKSVLFFSAVSIGLAIVVSCNNQQVQEPLADASLSADSLVKRGEYLVTVIGCGDCHSPKVMGPQGPMPAPGLELSGHPASQPVPKVDTSELKSWALFNHSNTAVAGPWGVSFAANITGDSTGIGGWTEAQFFRAMREGKYKGLENSRPLLPPMPWMNYTRMKDIDLKSIYAYLKTTGVKNVVPAAIPPTALGK